MSITARRRRSSDRARSALTPKQAGATVREVCLVGSAGSSAHGTADKVIVGGRTYAVVAEAAAPHAVYRHLRIATSNG